MGVATFSPGVESFSGGGRLPGAGSAAASSSGFRARAGSPASRKYKACRTVAAPRAWVGRCRWRWLCCLASRYPSRRPGIRRGHARRHAAVEDIEGGAFVGKVGGLRGAFYANKRKIWVDRIVILLIQIKGKKQFVWVRLLDDVMTD